MLGVDVLARDSRALTVSLNICQDEDRPFTAESAAGPWRVESRGGLLHRGRLLAALPLPNAVDGDRLLLTWHRAADVAVNERGWRSYRGGDRRFGFIHPPNERKRDAESWMLIVDRVEHGYVAPNQAGCCELVGSLDEWMGRKRTEPFVFIIAGRNVRPGRFRRCLDSLLRQRRRDWGAVVIDDASAPGFGDYLDVLCAPLSPKITVLRPFFRRGLLANMVTAIRHVCTNAETVIITLDADDALLGDGVIDRVAAEYARGADVTVGSMLRTDKLVRYPVDFRDPRANRGGNVWQHLRTFRKRLFDAVPDEDLRIDGEYAQLATDWAYMLPIVELARHSVHIPEPLYLYEPSGVGKGDDRENHEAAIAAIVRRPRKEKR